jgi:hypothetical protein
MGLEDWAMISAAILTIIYLVLFIFNVEENGWGAHTDALTPQQIVDGIKVCFHLEQDPT